MEFLIGRTLSNALLSLGIYDDVKTALEEMGLDLEELIDEENDPGLGNGGLGRTACFWTRWRRWPCRAAATGFATTTACSNRTLWKADRKSLRTTGLSTATRGNSNDTIRATKCALVAVFSRREKIPLG